MYEHNALGYWWGLALCLTKVRSSRARCPATALIVLNILSTKFQVNIHFWNSLLIHVLDWKLFTLSFDGSFVDQYIK